MPAGCCARPAWWRRSGSRRRVGPATQAAGLSQERVSSHLSAPCVTRLGGRSRLPEAAGTRCTPPNPSPSTLRSTAAMLPASATCSRIGATAKVRAATTSSMRRRRSGVSVGPMAATTSAAATGLPSTDSGSAQPKRPRRLHMGHRSGYLAPDAVNLVHRVGGQRPAPRRGAQGDAAAAVCGADHGGRDTSGFTQCLLPRAPPPPEPR